jgi:hypothetical protein
MRNDTAKIKGSRLDTGTKRKYNIQYLGKVLSSLPENLTLPLAGDHEKTAGSITHAKEI